MTPYYDENGITIYHGDCRDVLPTLETRSVDLVLTDPPYGIAVHTSGGPTSQPLRGMSRQTQGKRRWDRPIVGDDAPIDITPLLRFERLVIFGGQHFADQLPLSRAWIVWDKREGRGSDFCSDCEMAWTNIGNRNRMYSQMWRGMICVGEENGKTRLHPTQKPVALMTWIIEQHTKPGDLVLDPYMGSGPVARACKNTGRRYIGCEIVETYCAIAVTRLQQDVLHLEEVAV